MSTPLATATSTNQPLANVFFDYPGADIILRSQDSHHFRVPKAYIVNSSPILGGLLQTTLNLPDDENAEASLPVVQLQGRGDVLHCLLTFIFPVTPLLPSTPEEIMELLCVAQKYQMGPVLTHIRGSIGRQNSLPTCLEEPFRIYALAQKYGLRPEALQAARNIVLKQPMTIEDFDKNLDLMSGASLYELLKYHEKVRAILASDLTEFAMSGARGTIPRGNCTKLTSSQIPSWLDQYIRSIGKNPNLFDSAEFSIAMVRHLQAGYTSKECCKCASITSQTIRKFWEALAIVVDGSFKKAESALCLMQEREDPQAQINNPVTSTLEHFDISDTNLIIRSADLVDFRVHKLVLAVASPFFKDLLSLPQPSDGEYIDGIPVVSFSEDSELLSSLISMLYPVCTVMPNSYDKVLYLLAACQKYEMASIQSSIRAEVSHGASLVPKGAEVFTAYAIASAKELIPEMESAARLTLDHPMTFEFLGKGLRLFEGWALRDLVNYRRRCKDNLLACLDSFIQSSGPSSIWVGCPDAVPTKPPPKTRIQVLPKWLNQVLTRNQNDLKQQYFTHPLDIHTRIRGEYLKALLAHLGCKFCLEVHASKGSAFCGGLENKLAQARDKVCGDRGFQLGLTDPPPRNQ